jgi:hypothetical protein
MGKQSSALTIFSRHCSVRWKPNAQRVIEIGMPQEASTPVATLEKIREQGRKLRGEAE